VCVWGGGLSTVYLPADNVNARTQAPGEASHDCTALLTPAVLTCLSSGHRPHQLRLSSQDIPTPYNGTLENLTIIQPHQIVDAAKALKAGQV